MTLTHLDLPQPTPEAPLCGATVLVVEDSRFASEAVHLMCLHSGARMRRADTIEAAHRHLSVYRPTVVIVDIGLPDGSGGELISELVHAEPRVPVVLGTSGDDGGEAIALAAGADGFLPKPVESLARFQQIVLEQMPRANRPRGPRRVPMEELHPDTGVLAYDLEHAVELISEGGTAYAAQFLGTVACAAHDSSLRNAAATLAHGGPRSEARAAISARLEALHGA